MHRAKYIILCRTAEITTRFIYSFYNSYYISILFYVAHYVRLDLLVYTEVATSAVPARDRFPYVPTSFNSNLNKIISIEKRLFREVRRNVVSSKRAGLNS